MSTKQLSITQEEMADAIRVTSQTNNDISFSFSGLRMADDETLDDYRVMAKKVIADYVRKAYSDKECEYGRISKKHNNIVNNLEFKGEGYLDPFGTWASRQSKLLTSVKQPKKGGE